MDTSEFMIVLPSNASTNIFPANTVSSYKIKLQRPLPCTEGKWLVGLSEILYPSAWKTITNGAVCVKYIEQPATTARIINFKIRDGTYDNVSMLLREIKKNLARTMDHEQKIRFVYNNISKDVSLFVADGVSVQFSQSILNILGFKRKFQDFLLRVLTMQM